MLRWWLSRDGDAAWLAEQTPLAWHDGEAAAARDGSSAVARVHVDSTHRFQTLIGFGGAFTESAALTWQGLEPQARAQLLQGYFDPRQGHGYRLGRVHMNSCDFSVGHYSHLEQEDDHALASFSIARDRQALLPFIRAAQEVAGGALQLLLTPWSPPAWMKTNRRMQDGGRLRPDCRTTWARCFVRCIEAYAEQGVAIWGVSVQNEPQARQRWESCLYSGEEECDFIRDHLAPELAAAGLEHIAIVGWDHNRDALVERASVLYADPQVARRVWGMGFHWYMGDHFAQLQQVHEAWPDKQLLFTEGCQEGGPHGGEWRVAERYARSLVRDLMHWTCGWIDWNLLLDHRGGPNHAGNFCAAPALASADGRSLQWQPAYAALGHFARHLRPGAQRVLCGCDREALEATAFRNSDGSIAVVVLNPTDALQPLRLRLDGQDALGALPPHSIATYVGGTPDAARSG